MKKNKRKKGKLPNRIINTVIIIGVLTMLYPFVSQLYYSQLSKQNTDDFDKTASALEPYEIKERIRLATAYNDSLKGGVTTDPYVKKRLEEGRTEYARMLEVHEKIGHVLIPKIGEDLPIYAGTAESVLQKGVGHLEGSSLPIGGSSTHSVLTAHSGLPKNRLFTDLKKLKIGDNFYITNIQKCIAYKVDQIKVVEPTHFEDMQISIGRDYVTLLTCTPYMVNSHRLLVRGHRIPYSPKMEEKEKNIMSNTLFVYAIIILAILLLIIILLVRSSRKKRKKKEVKCE